MSFSEPDPANVEQGDIDGLAVKDSEQFEMACDDESSGAWLMSNTVTNRFNNR